IYHDAHYAAASTCRSVIAPPTFVAASAQFDPDYRLRPRAGEPWCGSGRTPSGADRPGVGQGTSLHAEQHFEYHRPLRPGDVLAVETEAGATWEKVSQRASKLSFSETITRYRDEAGDLVVTARLVRVVTERTVGS
ncbi:MAG TPA: MaoC family dehydratase N-terminal domain-containing protein, partial [Acidimicrobiia bacterium]|nr:MaoC family dehydratase N-terminal domain-containing protein [Acidimicrobiia bacterium]